MGNTSVRAGPDESAVTRTIAAAGKLQTKAGPASVGPAFLFLGGTLTSRWAAACCRLTVKIIERFLKGVSVDFLKGPYGSLGIAERRGDRETKWVTVDYPAA